MKKRGQAAMEFLMTYGWAIVVVLAAIGALAYFGVLSPNKLLPDRTTFATPLPNVDNAVINMSNSVQIAFKNNKGVAITLPLTATVAGGSSQCSGALTVTGTFTNSSLLQETIVAGVTQISNGGGFMLTFQCPANANAKVGERFKADFAFPYTNAETSQLLTQTGSVEGKYSLN